MVIAKLYGVGGVLAFHAAILNSACFRGVN